MAYKDYSKNKDKKNDSKNVQFEQEKKKRESDASRRRKKTHRDDYYAEELDDYEYYDE